ncbi:hypothetical protein [Microbispora sp. H13382]|uniref:hypothetical protein n=1 Tax=Microbispora sp. H13382 TaxID=2729112 RepID=UPI0015FF47B8|nr:hypothetical protein [Microbispora sp. H13382]
MRWFGWSPRRECVRQRGPPRLPGEFGADPGACAEQALRDATQSFAVSKGRP